tara:strand:- start:98 stop:694 length:597 start_codon:yes stop_codon:yes gene_type:complete
MKKNKMLKQMEMFDEMSINKLSPNQYYLLCCIRDSISPLKINMHLELRSLIAEDWLTPENKLTPKAHTLIGKIEKLFTIQKKKTSRALMKDNFMENIKAYKEMFPNQKLPSGKAARSANGNLEKAFRWFFDNFEYTWETILKATATYINEHQKNNYLYMRTSQYFIRKDNLSDLADLCENILTGGYEEEVKKIKVKVV